MSNIFNSISNNGFVIDFNHMCYKFIDNCNVTSMDGAGDFGYGFELVAGSVAISADKKVFSYQWRSEYGEGGAVTLEYVDGSTWPDLYN